MMTTSEHSSVTNASALPGDTNNDLPVEHWELAADSALSEDSALALLHSAEITSAALEQLSKNARVMKSRRVKLAVVEHPKTPRHISVPLVSYLFTFDLMQVALVPVAPADIKVAAERALIHRLYKISSGEKLSLARRASGSVAGALLLDAEPRIVRAALENPRLTETLVIKAITRRTAPAALVEAVCQHSHWSPRREIWMALLRSDKTPLARAIEFARGVPRPLLREILQNSRLPESTKSYLMKDIGDPRGHGREALE